MDGVLIIEEDARVKKQMAEVIEFMGYEPVVQASSADWKAKLDKTDAVYMIILGQCGSSKTLVDVFRGIKSVDSYLPVILAVDPQIKTKFNQELENGCIGTVDVPFRLASIARVLEQVKQYKRDRHQDGTPRSLELFRSLVGSSRSIQKVRKMIEKVAHTDANVLIIGESGSGKEVVARNIHYHSTRRSKPFVPLNCGAIPSELLESELFGHEKGAFTGAISARQGRFEMAAGGSLFLDEIGDMSLSMQVKLLRVLQERTFERVGSNKSINADVRIIAATHVNLEDAIAAGKFREDLYYRLNVFPIETPPLRERTDDLPLLIHDLVERLEHDEDVSISLTEAAISSLSQYSWPGNVRELANLIERLTILYPNGVIDIQDMPDKYQSEDVMETPVAEGNTVIDSALKMPRLPKGSIDLKEYINNIEYVLIQQALDEAGGIVAHAAKRLSMGRTTLVEKMRKLGLNRKESATEN